MIKFRNDFESLYVSEVLDVLERNQIIIKVYCTDISEFRDVLEEGMMYFQEKKGIKSNLIIVGRENEKVLKNMIGTLYGLTTTVSANTKKSNYNADKINKPILFARNYLKFIDLDLGNYIYFAYIPFLKEDEVNQINMTSGV